MIVASRIAAIAAMVAAVSTSVVAQTTGTIPPQQQTSEVTALPPPPAPDRYSSNEIINAGHRFFAGVSRDLAGIVERESGESVGPPQWLYSW
jgi:hypothetical protein